jgi:isopentenyl diphosphate isomerase/L-lactate dehydrogenase-like FMN-dependent dehydrogenase
MTASLPDRRRFLRLLAGSPLLANLHWPAELLAESTATGSDAALLARGQDLITSADQALNVFDLAAVAEQRLPLAHWAYLETGVEGEETLRANREAFAKYHLRPRRLLDLGEIDTSVTLFGTTWPSPLVLSPAGSHKAFHDDGEIATAKGARAQQSLQILSCVSTVSAESVIAARGGPVWLQLYPTRQWEITRALVRRGEAAGCPVLVVTIDQQFTDQNRETLTRAKRRDSRDCSECHVHPQTLAGYLRHKPLFKGLPTAELPNLLHPGMTWEFIGRLRQETKMKVVLKGIVTREDAKLCLRHGVDGVMVSNHGGRAEETGWATLDSLPEVVSVLKGKLPILVDGGFRRGTDVLKAIALGADAVGIGRPYLWGLAAFGPAGVERVLQLLRAELVLAMKATGARNLREIHRHCLGTH